MPTDNHKILIIVKNHTDYGYFRMALYNSKYLNADIAVFPFPFDAALIPTSLDYKDLKNSIENSKISYFDIKLRKFYKIDFSKYNRIILCHGNNTNDLMLLMFFAKYYNKPFYELDISNYKNNDGLAFFRNLDFSFIRNLFGKESLVSGSQIKKLQKDWDFLKEKDTGFHSVNNDGFVVNSNPDKYWEEISNILKDSALSLARLVGEMMSRHIFNTEQYVLKVILYFFLKGKLQVVQTQKNKKLDILSKNIDEINYQTLFKTVD